MNRWPELLVMLDGGQLIVAYLTTTVLFFKQAKKNAVLDAWKSEILQYYTIEKLEKKK